MADSKNDLPVDELRSVLEGISKKLQNAKALNGGFDSLMVKVDNIAVGQQKIVDDLKGVHDSLYAPDVGIFSRIQLSDIERKIMAKRYDELFDELKEWRNQDNSKNAEVHEENEQADKKRDEEFQAIVKEVQEISKWKKMVTAVAVWATGGVATGLAGLLAKLVYALITGGTF